MTQRSALFAGEVVHDRLRPKRHHLRYSVFSLLLDLDELPLLDRKLKLFSHNRAGLFSFYDRDHGNGGAFSLRVWVEELLYRAGIRLDGGSIRVLCYPRMFGYVFNPLTVFFCYDADEKLTAILYEVSNTHAEKHTYVLPVTDPERDIIRQDCNKTFFVSPFVSMNCNYRFRIMAPGDKVLVSISESDDSGPLLSAFFSGKRRTLSDTTLLAALFRYPLMTFKIIAGIHIEALRLWLKGIPVVPYQPAAQSVSSSIVGTDARKNEQAQ